MLRAAAPHCALQSKGQFETHWMAMRPEVTGLSVTALPSTEPVFLSQGVLKIHQKHPAQATYLVLCPALILPGVSTSWHRGCVAKL